MKRSKFWSASITLIAIIAMFSAFSMFGLVLGQESGSSEGRGEHQTKSSEGVEGSSGSEGEGESGDPSSPILALDESWDGVVNGVRTSMSYDAELGAFTGFVENPGDTALCFVQIELNLKQETQTVVELGPQPVGDLAPGAQMPVELLVADEPLAVGVAFDAWEIHPEVFDCGGPGPVNNEGSGEGEGSGANALALNQIYDVTRNGARLVMRYDEANNRFVGKVANMSKATLTRVRVEIHLSNGVELGPTTPTDVPAGHLLSVTLPATDQPFDSWTPHAEVGMSEGASGKGSGDHGGRSKAAAVDPDRWRKPRTPLTLGGVLTQHFSSGALYNSCDAPEQLLV